MVSNGKEFLWSNIWIRPNVLHKFIDVYQKRVYKIGTKSQNDVRLQMAISPLKFGFRLILSLNLLMYLRVWPFLYANFECNQFFIDLDFLVPSIKC